MHYNKRLEQLHALKLLCQFAFYCCDKSKTRTNTEKKVLTSCNNFWFIVNRSQLAQWRSFKETKRNMLIVFLPDWHPDTFLLQARPSCLGSILPPTVGRALLYHLSIKKMFHGHDHRSTLKLATKISLDSDPGKEDRTLRSQDVPCPWTN